MALAQSVGKKDGGGGGGGGGNSGSVVVVVVFVVVVVVIVAVSLIYSHNTIPGMPVVPQSVSLQATPGCV